MMNLSNKGRRRLAILVGSLGAGMMSASRAVPPVLAQLPACGSCSPFSTIGSFKCKGIQGATACSPNLTFYYWPVQWDESQCSNNGNSYQKIANCVIGSQSCCDPSQFGDNNCPTSTCS